VTVTQWEYTYIQAPTGSTKQVVESANKLGGLGWELVGLTSPDKTIGFNSNLLLFKRPLSNVPPPPATDEDWQEDPTGRFDKRRWDPALRVWTAETATMADKTMHVDPPHAVTPVL
jgi:hypothetical protein